MVTRHSQLRLYGELSKTEALDWSWVDGQLELAGTYWVTARTIGPPHPRPVWGVWLESRLYLSIGTPLTVEALSVDPRVTVHLDSGTEVVIVEGRAVGAASDTDGVAEYEGKYDWSYELDKYGPLTCIVPETVLAWRTAGWAGQGGFQQTGRWTFS